MLTDKQKKKLDVSFNKAAISNWNEADFVKMYAGKLPLKIDINDAMKYLNVKSDKGKKYTSSSTVKPEKDKS